VNKEEKLKNIIKYREVQAYLSERVELFLASLLATSKDINSSFNIADAELIVGS
jgi:hypothetical protein